MSRRELPPGKSAAPDERLRSVAARNVLIEQWKDLPGFVVFKKMRNSNHVKKLGTDEAVQVGFLALVRAAELWDESRNIKFNTYAVRSIMVNVIMAGLADGVIHIPHHLAGPAGRKYRYRREAEAARRFAEFPDWLSSSSSTVEKDYGEVLAAVSRLPEKLAFVVRRRAIDGAVLAQIGGELGVSKERIRQLYNKAVHLLQLALGVQPCRYKPPFGRSPETSRNSPARIPTTPISVGSKPTPSSSCSSPGSVRPKPSPRQCPRKTKQPTTVV